MRYYWVCEHYDSGVGLFKVHGCFTGWVNAVCEMYRLDFKYIGQPGIGSFYIDTREQEWQQ